MDSNNLEDIEPDDNYLNDFLSSIDCKKNSVHKYINHTNVSSNTLSILSYNIRSVNANLTEFLPVVEPDIMIFSETWFSDDFQADILNYETHHIIRSDRRSGGVSVYVNESLRSCRIDELSFANLNIEVCTVQLLFDTETIFIVGIYRPHSGTIEAFSSELENILQNDLLRNKRCIVAGDFNICLMQNNSNTSRLVETMQSLHYYPLITKPTRYSEIVGQLPTLLDHIWYNNLDVCSSGVVSYTGTDHRPTFLLIPLFSHDYNKHELTKITFRVNNSLNRENFKNEVDNFDWNLLSSTDINLYVTNFMCKIYELYCSNFPIKTKYISKRKAMNPWCTPDLINLIDQKSTYFELYRLGMITKQENNRFKNKVRSKIEKAKIDYYNDLFENNMGNIRSTWETLNKLMNRKIKDKVPNSMNFNGNLINDDLEISNSFNRFFANIPLDLDAQVPLSSQDPLHFVNPNRNSFLTRFEPCSPTEIWSIIKDLKNTKENKDTAPIKLIKANSVTLSVVISRMINHAMELGIFPNPLKIGTISPIFKKRGDPSSPLNYRPICKSPYLSKTFEKVIHSRLS